MALQSVYEVGVGKQFTNIATAMEQLYVDSGGTYVGLVRQNDGSLIGKGSVTVLLYPGTYTDAVTFTNPIACDSSNFITVQGVDRNSVIWNYNSAISFAILYFVFKNFTFQQRPLWTTGNFHTYDGMLFNAGAFVAPYECYGTRIVRCEISSTATVYAHSNNATYPIVVESCYFTGNLGAVSNAIVRGNIFTSGNGVIFGSSNGNAIVHSNLFLNISGNGIYIFNGQGPDQIRAKIYNNTFYNVSVGIFISAYALGFNGGNTIKNNVFYLFSGQVSCTKQTGSGEVDTFNNNMVYLSAGANYGIWEGSTKATLAAWQLASSQDANSVVANPLFVDPTDTNQGFKLQHRSPARRMGADLSLIFTTDYYGVTREIPWAVGAVIANGETVGGRTIGRSL